MCPTPLACLSTCVVHLPTRAQTLRGCTRQTALERQDLSCTYIPHHELKSIVIIIVIILFITTVTNIKVTMIIFTNMNIAIIVITTGIGVGGAGDLHSRRACGHHCSLRPPAARHHQQAATA